MKRFFIVVVLLCLGLVSSAQEHNIIYYSEYHTEGKAIYRQPVFIIITDIEIKIVDVKSNTILNTYNWIAVKVDKDKDKQVIRYKVIDDSGTLYNFALGYYYYSKETVLGIKELNILFRRLQVI